MKYFYLACLVITSAGGFSHGQCNFASVSPVAGSQSNPVGLSTIPPGQYPVFGTTMILSSPTPSVAGRQAFLFISPVLAATPYNGSVINGSIYLEILTSTGPIAAVPTPGAAPIWNIPVPGGVPLLPVYYIQTLHYDQGSGRYDASETLAVSPGIFGFDIQVVSVSATGLVAPGGGNVQVSVRNNGNASSPNFNLNATVGTAFGNLNVFPIAPGATVQRSVSVPGFLPPNFFPSCTNTTSNYPMAATAQIPDCNPNNNALNSSAAVTNQFFDLRVSITSAPNSVSLGGSASWTIVVSNQGNVPFPGGCTLRTGINLTTANPTCWSAGFVFNACGPGPIQFFPIGSIAPGGSRTFTVTGFCVSPGALMGQQFILAGLDNCSGICDACTTGNFTSRPITIGC